MLAINEKGYRIGEDHHRAKLTNHDIELIHALLDDGMSQQLVATKFDVSRRTVRDIAAGRIRCQTAARYVGADKRWGGR
jgi:DNA invertase Pin-like site-specific DNA recombinase